MSMSLDDIWDEPVVASPLRAPVPILAGDEDELARPSPAKRRRTTLFLSSDSEDGSPSRKKTPLDALPKAPRASTSRTTDIDALFDDIDDDMFADTDLAPALQLDALRKEAAAALPPLTPHEILPSSSSPRDFGDGAAGAGERQSGAKGKDGEGLHKRRTVPKLDDARLLDTDGFPALVKQAKHFQPRGKGHELADLNRLMQVYQFWSHKLYPRQTFRANVVQIEKLCHSKRMTSALGVWRDEFHGTINGIRPEEINLEREENDGDVSGEDSDTATRRRERAASSLPPSSPPRSPSGTKSSISAVTPYLTDDEDFDVDAAIREDEEQRRKAAAAAPVPPPVSQPILVPAISTASKAPAVDDDEDAAMWDEFDDSAFTAALTGDGSAILAANAATSSGPAAMDEDDDEDIWDVVRELEQERSRESKQNQPAPPGNESSGQAPATNDTIAPTDATTTSAPAVDVVPGQPKEKHKATNDEGWDEMYL